MPRTNYPQFDDFVVRLKQELEDAGFYTDGFRAAREKGCPTWTLELTSMAPQPPSWETPLADLIAEFGLQSREVSDGVCELTLKDVQRGDFCWAVSVTADELSMLVVMKDLTF